jgi:hypothetical protein
MLLTVSGLDAAPIKFKHLWGRYVLGFKAWKHCIACLKTKVASSITPEMTDGVYSLSDEHGLFYLCGVGQPDSERRGKDFARKMTNVHLAARPRQGSVAAIGSVYGVTFTIKGAQAIPIRPLPDGFQGLPEKHSRCKNFQFGYQLFEADIVGDRAPREVVYTLREERI